MTLDPRTEMTLELSRLAQEPSAADRARNLTALRERLGLPVPPVTPSGGHVATPELPRVSELPARPSVAAGQVANGKLAQLAAVAVVSAAIGFFAGARFTEPTAPAMHAPQTAPTQTPATTTPLSSGEPGVAGVAGVAGVDAGAPRAVVERSVAAERETAKARRSGTRRDPLAEPVTPRRAPIADDTSLQHAVRLLRRARSALSKHEPELALALLDELDERFPRTLLDEERGATRVLALCAHGQLAAAEQLARRLLANHPRSIYAPRIAQSCAAKAVEPSGVE
jgi:hypothetical protein